MVHSERHSRQPPVVVLDLPGNIQLLKGVASQARDYGWGILDLRNTRGHLLPGFRPVGLLSTGFLNHPLVSGLRKEGCVAIRVGRLPKPGDDRELPAILPDLSMAGRLAAEHFAERNFKHVGYIGHLPWHEHPYAYVAFRERAAELGCVCHLLQIKPPPEGIPPAEHFRLNIEQILDWLLGLPKPVGVFTYHDRFAATIFTTAMRRGIESPEAVALLGIGNDPSVCDLLPVPLSSIDTHEEERGRQAVVLLKKLIDGEPTGEMPMMIPPGGIVERQSTNLLAVPDPVVARALRFIWDHFREQLSVAEVAAVAGVARSTLCAKFNECLGRGVNAELRRKRLENCKKLLRTTDLTIAEIADVSGFPSASYLYKAFHDAFGLTPRTYRLKEAGESS